MMSTELVVRPRTVWQPCVALRRSPSDCEERSTVHLFGVCEHEHMSTGQLCTGHWRMERDGPFTCEACGHVCRIEVTVLDSRCLSCDCHHPRLCCDPNDCGPCCPDCPTCPSLG